MLEQLVQWKTLWGVSNKHLSKKNFHQIVVLLLISLRANVKTWRETGKTHLTNEVFCCRRNNWFWGELEIDFDYPAWIMEESYAERKAEKHNCLLNRRGRISQNDKKSSEDSFFLEGFPELVEFHTIKYDKWNLDRCSNGSLHRRKDKKSRAIVFVELGIPRFDHLPKGAEWISWSV